MYNRFMFIELPCTEYDDYYNFRMNENWSFCRQHSAGVFVFQNSREMFNDFTLRVPVFQNRMDKRKWARLIFLITVKAKTNKKSFFFNFFEVDLKVGWHFDGGEKKVHSIPYPQNSHRQHKWTGQTGVKNSYIPFFFLVFFFSSLLFISSEWGNFLGVDNNKNHFSKRV